MPEPRWDAAEAAATPPLEPAADPPKACSLCAEPIRGTYFRSENLVFCPSCREAAGAEVGTPARRFLRASAFGSLVAILCAAVWYAVIVWTDREFGLLAVLVGLAVGATVRFGSHRRGGWHYQALAMFLTYAAIVTSYVPLLLQAAVEASDEAGDPSASLATLPAVASSETFEPVPIETEAAQAPSREAPIEPIRVSEDAPPPDFASFVFAIGALAGLAFAAPFLMGFENFLGWVILAIALYEAWKLNRREELRFEGPFQLPGTRSTYVPETPPPPIAP